MIDGGIELDVVRRPDIGCITKELLEQVLTLSLIRVVGSTWRREPRTADFPHVSGLQSVAFLRAVGTLG